MTTQEDTGRVNQKKRTRIAIVEAEQKELALFMTPAQRARYIGLQQQFRRRAQELSRQNGAERNGVGQQQARPGLKIRAGSKKRP